jgi:hypothetical protein
MVILSGLGVEPIKSLTFLKIFFGTAKPDIVGKTRQGARAKILRKPLIFRFFPLLSAYFRIPDNFTVDSQGRIKNGACGGS